MLTVLDARRADCPASLFADATHLNCRGAIALSRAVAAAIEPRLSPCPTGANSGWIIVDLPDDHPARFAVPLEDLEESQSILRTRITGFASSR